MFRFVSWCGEEKALHNIFERDARSLPEIKFCRFEGVTPMYPNAFRTFRDVTSIDSSHVTNEPIFRGSKDKY